MSKNIVGILFSWLSAIILVIAASALSSSLWKTSPENNPTLKKAISLSEDMKLKQVAEMYSIPGPVMKKAFGLKSKADLEKTVSDLGMPVAQAENKLKKALAFHGQESTKNWKKIALKFALWAMFLIFVYTRLRAGKITPASRKYFAATAVILFGVILGSDPSPMGTVKDAIVLWGRDKIIFPPRMIALAVFLAMVVLANKFICSWGCQFGTLQELVFRLNRNRTDTVGIIHQIKVPFLVSNTIRILFFAVIFASAILWSTDFVSPIDPFKIFNPVEIGIAGAIFIGALLVSGLFVYRPWCNFFCPFGLVGWLFERISINRISVNYNTCIACEKCAKACPSTVMNSILKRESAIPDCFSCGTCIDVCPTKSIEFGSRKRKMPPPEKFRKAKKV